MSIKLHYNQTTLWKLDIFFFKSRSFDSVSEPPPTTPPFPCNCKDGEPGKDGRDGRDGMTVVGPPGPPGRNGLNGTDGMNGRDGQDGRDGRDGQKVSWGCLFSFAWHIFWSISLSEDINKNWPCFFQGDQGLRGERGPPGVCDRAEVRTSISEVFLYQVFSS